MDKGARTGLSPIQLALVFLTGVAVCAVFFALGFLVARGPRSHSVSAADSNTEEIPSPAPAPTPVNSAAGATKSENASYASAAAEGAVPRSSTAPSPGLSTLSANPSPAPPTRVPEVPPTSESTRLAAAPPASSRPQSTASSGEVASNAVTAPPSRPARPTPGGRFVVQVSAVGVRQDAETLVNLLRSRGYPAFLVTPEAAGAGDKLFRVQVGPYNSDPEAVGVRSKLMADGFKPFVRH